MGWFRSCSVVCMFLSLSLACLPAGAEKKPAERPSHWAAPVVIKACPNLHRVTDSLYRSAQPSRNCMMQLKKIGVRTVINLRSVHSDRDELKGIDMKYIHIPVVTWRMDDEHIQQALGAMLDPKNQPVLVHCQHGADRTGALIAMYRVVVQGWSKPKAVEEMKSGGYGHHSIWKNLIELIEKADIQALRSKLGIKDK